MSMFVSWLALVRASESVGECVNAAFRIGVGAFVLVLGRVLVLMLVLILI